ncbi:MAG: hypothetical protein JWM88_3 [Verrucomicrobia bacterium]|nr:hypothetical protein [Verrucomicrobiota bacterium]
MSKKVDRALYGPSWTEVILGAVLAAALGVVLAAVYLVLKPVTQVKEIPKEPVPGMIYYIEGSHDSAKARRLVAKQQAFLKGGPIELSEDELNLAVMPVTTSTPAKSAPPAKGAPPAKTPAAEPEATGFLTAGASNFRLTSGRLQMSVPLHVKYALVGLDTTILVQSQGVFEKVGDVFVYQPDTVYLGSCPVHRIPMLKGMVMKKFLNADRFPPDMATAWDKLADVRIEGSTLKLGMAKP